LHFKLLWGESGKPQAASKTRAVANRAGFFVATHGSKAVEII